MSFKPGPFDRQVALVHTECQECGTRYDVAVRPEGGAFDLRDKFSYTDEFGIGDPPNACVSLGARCSAGYAMSSVEIAVLEFWDYQREASFRPLWIRDPAMEGPIPDHYDSTRRPRPVFERIYDSERKADWMKAREAGDYPTLVRILEEVGCSRSQEVAHMLDVERRQRLFLEDLGSLRNARFPSP